MDWLQVFFGVVLAILVSDVFWLLIDRMRDEE